MGNVKYNNQRRKWMHIIHPSPTLLSGTRSHDVEICFKEHEPKNLHKLFFVPCPLPPEKYSHFSPNLFRVDFSFKFSIIKERELLG